MKIEKTLYQLLREKRIERTSKKRKKRQDHVDTKAIAAKKRQPYAKLVGRG